jgi:hypothetical protein
LHWKFVPPAKTFNLKLCLQVLECLRQVSPCESRTASWQMDRAPWQPALLHSALHEGPHSLIKSCSMWLLPLPYQQESSQGITFWYHRRHQNVMSAILNNLQENDFWKCLESWSKAGIHVQLQDGNTSKETIAVQIKISYNAACNSIICDTLYYYAYFCILQD